MWKDYLAGYMKNNRFTGMAVRVSAFISALLLSLLCGLFYNLWKYEVERIKLEEGGWQSRIVGELRAQDIVSIRNFASVKAVEVKEKEGDSTEITADIYFDSMGAVLEDTPKLAELVGVPPEAVTYHYGLLAMYLVRSPQDTAPRLVFPLFILVMGIASFSLVVIIHSAFAVSMDARVHQFGIFSSIGATPKQIRACLLQEAAALCAVPVLAGDLLGIAASLGLVQITNILLGSGTGGRHESVFGYHPLVFVLTLLVTALTVWISAWIPARKLSRLTPLEAIKNTGGMQLKRRKKSYVLAFLFGIEGELAGNALKAQQKALRTASLSLAASFLAFTLMQCFFTLSAVSTEETFFERYQDVWDIMVTLKDTDVDSFGETGRLQGLPGVESAIVYQKAAAKRIITEEEMSGDMKSFGGFSKAPGNYVGKADGGWLVNAPVVILDDNSFFAYCEQIGIAPRLDGAAIWNRIRDVTNPDFRHPQYMPYIKGENATSVLRQAGNEKISAKIPVLAYTEEVPRLREEYATLDHYELVHFIPASLWKEVKEKIGGTGQDSYICVLARENGSRDKLDALQGEISGLVEGAYRTESENRIQAYETNAEMIQGMMAILGGFCVLLAVIGIGNVLSNTLGFVRQRKREIARYMSVGMTPKEIRKMFCIEAVALAARPVLAALPAAVLAVGFMLRASYVAVGEFLAKAPLVPVFIFMLAILGSVALIYGLGWRNVRKVSLAEVLRDDTLM